MGVQQLSLSPGFRFHPTDEELLVHYLIRKVKGQKFTDGVIGVVDIYKHEPWDLPDMAILQSRDPEWYFFSSPDRKYSRGSRASRTTAAGFWKATGKDRKVISGKSCVGMKKTLVFYIGRVPNGERTDWVMYEYRVNDELEQSVQADEVCVLCRVRKKGGPGPRIGEQYGASVVDDIDEMELSSNVTLPGLFESETTPSDMPPDHSENSRTAEMGSIEELQSGDDLDALLDSLLSADQCVNRTQAINYPQCAADGVESFVETTIDNFHDLVHPAVDETGMLEELLHQASGKDVGYSAWDSWIHGDAYDGALGDYMELIDLEVPIESVFAQPEDEEEDCLGLDGDGWIIPRIPQSLDSEESYAIGGATQRVHLQVTSSNKKAVSTETEHANLHVDVELITTSEVSWHNNELTSNISSYGLLENEVSTSSLLSGSHEVLTSCKHAASTSVSKQNMGASVVRTHKQLPARTIYAKDLGTSSGLLEGENIVAFVEACLTEGAIPCLAERNEGFNKGTVNDGDALNDSLKLSQLYHTVDDTLDCISSPPKPLASLSTLFFNVLSKAPTRPAFAAGLSNEFELLKNMEREGSLNASYVGLPSTNKSMRLRFGFELSSSHLSSPTRAKSQNVNVLSMPSFTTISNCRTSVWASLYGMICGLQSRGFRVFFRVTTAVVLLICLLRGFWRLFSPNRQLVHVCSLHLNCPVTTAFS